MASVWPAIIAVIGTLSGSALTLLFAWRDKEATFKREWVRKEFETRTEVYNEILAAVLRVYFGIKELKNASENKTLKASWISDLQPMVWNMRDAVSSRTLYCSQAMRQLHNEGLRACTKTDTTQGAAAYLDEVQRILGETLNAMEQQASQELSLKAFQDRLRG